jgi:parvulin-like peptidyl-prolyl isomerase/DNA-binding phage protein
MTLQYRFFNAARFASLGFLVVGMTSLASAQATRPGNSNPTAPKIATRNATPAAAPAKNSPVSPGVQSTPSVVATVNGLPISRDELGRECLVRYGDSILENMLNKFLIQQACQAQNIQITQKMVDDEIGRIASKFSLNVKMYLKLIEDERNISPEQYASDIVWPMLALRELSRDKIQITDAEVNQAYESQYGPKVQVRMIAVKELAKAQQLLQQVKADPNSFRRLAKEHSEDAASASVEGMLPPIRMYSGDDALEKLAFSLKQDQISDVLAIGEMHLFLQCVRHLPPTPPAPDAIAMVQQTIRHDLEDAKLREMAETMFGTLRENSSVEKVLGNAELEKQNPGVAAVINRQPIPLNLVYEEAIKRNGVKVLEGEINRKLLEGALASIKETVTQAEVDNEIQRAAEYYGCINKDGTPNVQEWLKMVLEEDGATYELYVRDAVWPTVALKKLVASKVQVTEEDLAKGFESSYGPRAEILAIVFSNQRTAQEVWEMARANPTEQFFGELATQYSVEPTSRSNFGKVPPLRRHGGQPTLEKVAFDLKPGDMSGIIEVSDQYVILRSQGLTNPVVKDFNVVKEDLYKDILEKKTRTAMEKELEQLLASAMIENFLENKAQLGTAATDASRGALKQSPTAPKR